jgi:hypothetical protein
MQLPGGQLHHLPQGEVRQGRSARDEVQRRERTPPPTQILWFNLECPERFDDYRNPLKLRAIFTNVKKGKGLDRPAYVRL